MSAEPVPLRQWRVTMKNGDTWVVAADKLEPTPYLGLSFMKDGIAIAGAAYASYTSWEEIDPATGETMHVQRFPGTDAERVDDSRKEPKKVSAKDVSGKTRTQMIRATEAGDAYYDKCDMPDGEHNDISQLILSIDSQKPEGEPLKGVRATFKDIVGGFPPQAYLRFKEAVSYALLHKLVEVFDGEA